MVPGELPVERIDIVHEPAALTDWLADTQQVQQSTQRRSPTFCQLIRAGRADQRWDQDAVRS